MRRSKIVPAKRTRGFSLLEVLAAIVVLGLVFAGFATVYSTVLRHGSDAQLLSQATSVAAAYMDEILSKPYLDPDTATVCGTPEATRPSFDNTCDYDKLALNGCTATSSACPSLGSCACDASGAPVDGLGEFTVSVNVTASNLSGASGLAVTVTAQHAAFDGDGVSLMAYRTQD